MGEVQLLFDLEIPIGAPLSGHRLVPGTEGSLGLPVEAFLRLYAVDAAGTPKRMRNLIDVLGLIEAVRSEEEAMELLRLETAPETHFLFPHSHHIDARVCRALERIGDVTERGAAAAGYQAASCLALGEGFEATRDLIRLGPSNPLAVVRRREHLSRTAQYRLIGDTTLGAIDRSEILLPEYE